jgi:hypothetical protein
MRKKKKPQLDALQQAIVDTFSRNLTEAGHRKLPTEIEPVKRAHWQDLLETEPAGYTCSWYMGDSTSVARLFCTDKQMEEWSKLLSQVGDSPLQQATRSLPAITRGMAGILTGAGEPGDSKPPGFAIVKRYSNESNQNARERLLWQTADHDLFRVTAGTCSCIVTIIQDRFGKSAGLVDESSSGAISVKNPTGFLAGRLFLPHTASIGKHNILNRYRELLSSTSAGNSSAMKGIWGQFRLQQDSQVFDNYYCLHVPGGVEQGRLLPLFKNFFPQFIKQIMQFTARHFPGLQGKMAFGQCNPPTVQQVEATIPCRIEMQVSDKLFTVWSLLDKRLLNLLAGMVMPTEEAQYLHGLQPGIRSGALLVSLNDELFYRSSDRFYQLQIAGGQGGSLPLMLYELLNSVTGRDARIIVQNYLLTRSDWEREAWSTLSLSRTKSRQPGKANDYRATGTRDRQGQGAHARTDTGGLDEVHCPGCRELPGVPGSQF